MKCLLLRLTSMGDLVHIFPAIADAKQAISGITFDILVDRKFADIVRANEHITKTFAISYDDIAGLIATIKEINDQRYDLIIDLHNILKTSWLNILLRGRKHTFSHLKEFFLTPIYDAQYDVSSSEQVYRYKELFSKIFDYRYEDGILATPFPARAGASEPYLLFLTSSSWRSKEPSVEFWGRLADLEHSKKIYLLTHDKASIDIASHIKGTRQNIEILPPKPLAEVMEIVQNATGIIGVDTGLAHLGASMGVPSVMIFGATGRKFYSFYENLASIQSLYNCSSCYNKKCTKKTKCYDDIDPSSVWQVLREKIVNKK